MFLGARKGHFTFGSPASLWSFPVLFRGKKTTVILCPPPKYHHPIGSSQRGKGRLDQQELLSKDLEANRLVLTREPGAGGGGLWAL